MADLHVVDELRDYLIGQNVAQAQDEAPSTGVPSIWVDPRAGAPTPREGEDCTITLRDTMLMGPPTLEAWLEEAFIDVIVRHRNSAPAAKLVHRTIRYLIQPHGQLGGRKHWDMNDLLVEYSTVWRGEQPLPFQQTGDLVTYDRVASYRFGCRRKSLAGLPYVP